MTFAPRIDNIDKNYLMNGAMDLFQRFISPSPFTGVSLTTSFTFVTADRWAQKYAGTWTGGTPASCSSTNVPNQMSKYSLNFIGGPSVITDEVDMRQRIESRIAAELSGKVVSLGLWINTDSASHITLELWTPQGPDNYTTSNMIYTSTKAFAVGSWQQVSFDGITLPSTVNGLEVRFRISNNTVLVGTTHTYITQIGLNIIPSFDEFNRHGGTIISEIHACQRYYEKSYNLEVNPGTIDNTGAGQWFALPSLTNSLFNFDFSTRKRVTPTMIWWSPVTGAMGKAYNNGGGDETTTTAVAGEGRASQATIGGGGPPTSNYLGHYTADAEDVS